MEVIDYSVLLGDPAILIRSVRCEVKPSSDIYTITRSTSVVD